MPPRRLFIGLVGGIAGAIFLAPASIQAAKSRPGPLVVNGDGVMTARIAGRPALIRLTPWAPPAPVLNPDFAKAAGLKRGWFGFAVKVGPVRVTGDTGVTQLSFAGFELKRRVVWFDRRYDAEADAALGPGGVPADVVRFELRPPFAGETRVVLPMVNNLFQPTYSRVMVGGRPLNILFDPQHARTLATAGAGALIAAAHDGRLTGGQGRAEIAFGIDRPVRTLALARPLAVGPLRINRLAVRIADGGSVAGIRDEDSDPEEIVVTAKERRKSRDVLIIGREQLDRCSSIVFDKRAKTITLSCE